MPRKSTSSLPAGDNTIAVPANSETAVGSTLEGDTSMLSIATDASTNTKAKANGKTTKEDTDSVGVDVCL